MNNWPNPTTLKKKCSRTKHVLILEKKPLNLADCKEKKSRLKALIKKIAFDELEICRKKR